MSETTAEAKSGETPHLGQVVGENVRQLRKAARWTQHETAVRLQANGVRWARSQLAAFEAGNREAVDIGTVVLLARAFGVAPARLFAGDGPVKVAAEATWTRQALRELLSDGTEYATSEPLKLTGHALRAFIKDAGGEVVLINPLQADIELASRLGVASNDVTRAAEQLWGHSLQRERDRRIAEMEPMTEAQRRTRRGHVTRKLAREIEPLLAKDSM